MLWRWCGINISSGWMLRSGNASGRESGTNSRGSWLGRGKKSWRRPRRRVGSAGQAAAMAVAATYLASWASLGGGKRRLVLRKMGLRRLSFLDLFSLYVFCLRGFGRRRLVERSAYRSLLTKIFERYVEESLVFTSARSETGFQQTTELGYVYPRLFRRDPVTSSRFDRCKRSASSCTVLLGEVVFNWIMDDLILPRPRWKSHARNCPHFVHCLDYSFDLCSTSAFFLSFLPP